jgi:cobalt-zinc-cadmium efflux system membrane fusion protein
MAGRVPLIAVAAFAVGIGVASLVPGVSSSLRKLIGFQPAGVPSLANARQESDKEAGKAEDKPIVVKLTDEQIAEAHIELVAAQSGVLSKRVIVPGSIVPDANRVARVAVKLSGTVAELRKNLGDPVAKGEVLGILESREVADAKSEFLAARLTNGLQQDLFERDKALWDKRVSNEQQFLRSRNEASQAKMRLDIARQKLFALGLTEAEIRELPDESEQALRRQEIRSPIEGQVAERKVELGMAVGRDNLETEFFVIVDLEHVWVEAAVTPSNLPAIKVGQRVAITARGVSEAGDGRIVFISPLVDRESRSARVVIDVANPDGRWRPGSFVTAAIATGDILVPLAAPKGAIQSVNNEKVVFVQTPEGFEKRPVTIGRSDERLVEVVAGLEAGDMIATTGTFVLKAELLKSSADED